MFTTKHTNLLVSKLIVYNCFLLQFTNFVDENDHTNYLNEAIVLTKRFVLNIALNLLKMQL